MKTKCQTHKTYKGVRRPKVQCLDCWILFLTNNPNETIRGTDFLNIINAMLDKVSNVVDRIEGLNMETRRYPIYN